MSKIGEILDSKFAEAIELTIDSEDAIHAQFSYEIIGLDGQQGSAFRYFIVRPFLDKSEIKLTDQVRAKAGDLAVSHQMAKIDRDEYDDRPFSLVPPDEMSGTLVYIDSTANRGLEINLRSTTPKILGEAAIDALALELSGLSVVKQLPTLSL